MEIRTGTRFRSQVDETEIIVVRPPSTGIELTCGGHPMIDAKAEPEAGLMPIESHTEGTQLGKRYILADSDLEVLVTKPGAGSLAADGRVLELKEAKPLPASD